MSLGFRHKNLLFRELHLYLWEVIFQSVILYPQVGRPGVLSPTSYALGPIECFRNSVWKECENLWVNLLLGELVYSEA